MLNVSAGLMLHAVVKILWMSMWIAVIAVSHIVMPLVQVAMLL